MLRATIAENTWKAPRMSRNSRSSCTFLSGSVAPLMAKWGTTNRFSSSHILESLLNGPNHWSRPDQGSGAYLMLVSSTRNNQEVGPIRKRILINYVGEIIVAQCAESWMIAFRFLRVILFFLHNNLVTIFMNSRLSVGLSFLWSLNFPFCLFNKQMEKFQTDFTLYYF